jgi:hypothetical protein
MVIDLFREEFRGWRKTLPVGVESTLKALSQPGAAGEAVQLDVESRTRLVQATLWESGEVDMIIGDRISGDILLNEHREITSLLGTKGLLDDVFRAVSE